jgi:alkylation response protein AidB-like acyl-CoA dehydrogenase
VNLDLGPELAEFRREIGGLLEELVPQGLAEVCDWYLGVTILGASNRQGRLEGYAHASYKRWESNLLEHGLVYPHWPAAVGGRGWDSVRTAIFSEELYRLRVPRIERGFGADLVGSALLSHGTPEQQERFLGPIIRGDHLYCQGFSEPNHGSDLAAVETKGVIDGDELVITGQKVWTSEYEHANMMFALCSTEFDQERHRRLTFVILPFNEANGVDVRPTRQITGAYDFAEEFLVSSRAPLSNVIGGFGNGWKVAMSTLDTERTGQVLWSYLVFEHEVERLVRTAIATGAADDALIRQRLAHAHTRTRIMRCQAHESTARLAAGQPLSDHTFAAKLLWSEHQKAVGDLAMDIVGGAGLVRPSIDAGEDDDYLLDEWQDLYLSGRAATIFAGTSEIQRTIIADRVLRLPR